MARGSFGIGQISGIRINIDYSWFFIFLLVTWSLAGSYFPAAFPEWSIVQSVSAGLVTSLLFFASVLAHELGHSVTKPRTRHPGQPITLLYSAGWRISRKAESSGVEFKSPSRSAYQYRRGGCLLGIVLSASLPALRWRG